MNAKSITLMAVLVVAHGVAMQAAFASSDKNKPFPVPSHRSVQPKKISLTKAEARAAGMARLVEHFDNIDANKDGVVTRKELRAYALATRPYAPMT